MRIAALILSLAACLRAGRPTPSRRQRRRLHAAQFAHQARPAVPDRTCSIAGATRSTTVSRERSRAMLSQFSKCLYNRSREGSLALLQKTDYGFNDFAQIGLDNDRAVRDLRLPRLPAAASPTRTTPASSLRFSAGGAAAMAACRRPTSTAIPRPDLGAAPAT